MFFIVLLQYFTSNLWPLSRSFFFFYFIGLHFAEWNFKVRPSGKICRSAWRSGGSILTKHARGSCSRPGLDRVHWRSLCVKQARKWSRWYFPPPPPKKWSPKRCPLFPNLVILVWWAVSTKSKTESTCGPTEWWLVTRKNYKHRVTIPCKRSFDFTWNPPDFTWNPADFMKSLVIAPTLHSSNWRDFAETLAFIILGGFHRWNLGWTLLDVTGEIHQISGWNLVDFMKSLVIAPTLHSSNWRVFAETLAFIILGGFHRWNLGEIHQISWLKSTRFQGEIHQISRVKSPTLHSSNWSFC